MSTSPPAPPRARILLVGDDADDRRVLERALASEHVVECAAGGRPALRLIADRAFDLVLLDVVLADGDGCEVLDRLKGSPATRDVPVIMTAARADAARAGRCIERGAEDFLLKPVDPVLLRARVGASLGTKRRRDAEAEYLRQVALVVDAAALVEAGTYVPGSLAAVGRRADELGRLARVFDSMAASTAVHARAREERLRTQASDLKREVEAAWRAGKLPT